MEIPVATEAVAAPTDNTGFVAPFAPTVSAEALVEVMVVAPLIAVVSDTALPRIVFPVVVRLTSETPARFVVPENVTVPENVKSLEISIAP
jgi:hypothetical protein